MKSVLILLLGLVSFTAQARPTEYTTQMTCGEVKYVVRQQEQIRLCSRYLDCHLYVSSQIFCELPEVALRAFVPTKDRRRCALGYVCRR